jgi:hypothetical protein
VREILGLEPSSPHDEISNLDNESFNPTRKRLSPEGPYVYEFIKRDVVPSVS